MSSGLPGVDMTGRTGKSREKCQEPGQAQVTVTVLSSFVSAELWARQCAAKSPNLHQATKSGCRLPWKSLQQASSVSAVGEHV